MPSRIVHHTAHFGTRARGTYGPRSPSLSRLEVEGDGRHVPRHASGDHWRGRLPVLFKMCRRPMCLQGGRIVVDLVEEHMVRVAVLEQHHVFLYEVYDD